MPLHWFLFGLACAAALPAAFTLDPVLDTDTWWHMATGRWIVEHREVPWLDPFGWHPEPTRWYAYSWLYDIVLFEIFHHRGYAGIIVCRTILVAFSTLTAMLFLVRRSGVSYQTVIVALLAGVVLMMFAKERPWHFTIVFTTLTLWAVESIRETGKMRRTWWLLPMFALWANLHIQFVLGWLILFLACCFPGIADRRKLIGMSLLCLAATACNPYHIRLLTVIQEYAQQSAPAEFVDELAPPDFHFPSTIATLALLSHGVVCQFRHRRFDLFALALMLIAAAFAARMRRDLWFASLAGIAAMTVPTVPAARRTLLKSMAIIVGVIALIRLVNFDGIGPSSDFNAADPFYLLPPQFSEKASLWGTAAPIFTTFDLGGRVIWEWGGPVNIDGRTNVYGDAKLRNVDQIWSGDGDWKLCEQLWKSNRVVAPAGTLLAINLEAHEQWAVAFRNAHVVILDRKW